MTNEEKARKLKVLQQAASVIRAELFKMEEQVLAGEVSDLGERIESRGVTLLMEPFGEDWTDEDYEAAEEQYDSFPFEEEEE
jgi:hypothetical protein